MKKKLNRVTIIAALLISAVLFLFPACESTSDPTSTLGQGRGIVRGTVTSTEGVVQPNAVILVDGVEVTTTDSDGEFSLELEPGTYTITAQVDGVTVISFTVTVTDNAVTDTDDDGDTDSDDSDSDSDDGDNDGTSTNNGIGQCVSQCVQNTDMIGVECVAACRNGEYTLDE